MARAFSCCYCANRSRGKSEPKHEAESPSTVILPRIPTHGIPVPAALMSLTTPLHWVTARDRGISLVFT